MSSNCELMNKDVPGSTFVLSLTGVIRLQLNILECPIPVLLLYDRAVVLSLNFEQKAQNIAMQCNVWCDKTSTENPGMFDPYPSLMIARRYYL